MTQHPVAVIGAAGQTGRPIVEALARAGSPVRAVVHRIDPAVAWPDGTDIVAADLRDVDTLRVALEGSAVAYYIPPVFTDREEEYGENVVAAATAAGLHRLVYHSVMHAKTPEMPHHWRKFAVEERLRADSLPWTILRPAMYSQTPLSFVNTKRTSLRAGFDPTRPFTPVDLEDLGEAAARVLLGDGHEGATYELAGTEVLTFEDMARVMSQVWGHRVTVRRVPSWLAALVGSRRFGPDARSLMKAMLDHYDAHGFVGTESALPALLGREPIPFAQVVKRFQAT